MFYDYDDDKDDVTRILRAEDRAKEAAIEDAASYDIKVSS